MLQILLLVILLTVFIIIVFKKSKYYEKAQIEAPDLIADAVSCDFCLSFWVGLIVTSVVFPILCSNLLSLSTLFYWVAIPAAGAVITRKLI